VTVALLMMISSNGFASTILNGDFSTPGLADWHTPFGFGPATDGGGFALLEDAAGPDFAYSIAQDFLVTGSGETLSFDFSFSSGSSGNFFPDSFAVGIASSDFSDPLVEIVVVDEVFGVFTDPGLVGLSVVYTDAAVIPGFVPQGNSNFSGHVTLLMPDFLTGDLVTLYFDFYDDDFVTATSVAVDNVTIASAEVAEPAAFGLLLAGIFAMTRLRRSGKSRSRHVMHVH
jgi:hypothetical protein